MADILKEVTDFFTKEGEQLVYEFIPYTRTDKDKEAKSDPLYADEAYIQIEMTEMFLGKSQVLFKNFFSSIQWYSKITIR